MTIDDLIIRLYEIRQEHGNLDILQWDDDLGRLFTVDDDKLFLTVAKPERKISAAEAREKGIEPVYPAWPLADSLDPSSFTDKVVIL